MDTNDNNLKKLFSELKAEDLQNLPLFREVVPSSVTATANLWRPSWLRLAWGVAPAALAVVVISFATWRFHGNRSSEVEFDQWAALSDWTASTDILLVVSDGFLRESADSPTDFLINFNSDLTQTNLHNP